MSGLPILLTATVVLAGASAALAATLIRERRASRIALDEAWSRQSVQALESEHRIQLTLRISSIVGSNIAPESMLPQILDILSRHFSRSDLRLLMYRGSHTFALFMPQSSVEETVDTPGLLEVLCHTGFLSADERLAGDLRIGDRSKSRLYNLPIIHGDTFAGTLVLASESELPVSDQRFLRDIIPALAAALRNHSLTDRFGRAVDSRVRDHLMSASARPGGEIREAGILFVDLVGFTAQAESLSPERIVEFLNAFFSRCQTIIAARGGIINKFLGDGFMAMFGVPQADPEFARRLLEAGHDIIAAGPEFEALARGYGIGNFGMALGAEAGSVLAGTIGSSERLEYTLMGDVVNVASRLEGLTRFFGVGFLAGEGVRTASSLWTFRNLGRIRPKGKSRSLDIFEVIGPEDSVDEPTRRRIGLFEEGLSRYQARDFSGALALWASVEPRDKALEWYRSQASAYLESPPPESWDGAENFRAK
jgi:class 3 adenylate cyclase